MRAFLLSMLCLALVAFSGCSDEAHSVEERPTPSAEVLRAALPAPAVHAGLGERWRSDITPRLTRRRRAALSEALALGRGVEVSTPLWPEDCRRARPCRRASSYHPRLTERLGRERLFFAGGALSRAGRDVLSEARRAGRHGVSTSRLRSARAVQAWSRWRDADSRLARLDALAAWSGQATRPCDLRCAARAGRGMMWRALRDHLVDARGRAADVLDRALLEAWLGFEYGLRVETPVSGRRTMRRALSDEARWSRLKAAVIPPIEGYDALGAHLLRYQALWASRGAFEALPEELLQEPALGLGDRHEGVEALRRRLIQEALLEPEHAEGEVMDAAVVGALEAFQRLHTPIPVTGRLDAVTLEHLAIPLCHKIGALEVALEQWRESPLRAALAEDDVTLWTNVPGFVTDLYVEGARVIRQKSAVGKITSGTPRFSSTIRVIELNPPWYGTKTIQIYEPPGPESSLGRAALRMPDYPWPILWHGTKTPSDFERADRSISHGCIRLEAPEAIAAELLRLRGEEDGPAWVEAAMEDPEYTTVKRRVSPGVPAITDYIIAGVSKEGALRFHGDPYYIVWHRGWRDGETCAE